MQRNGSPRSREDIAVGTYLRRVTTLDDSSLQKLRELLRITVDLRRQTHHTHTRRIQRGSPGAGALGATVGSFRPQVDAIANDLEQIVASPSNDGIPGMYLIRAQFRQFRETLSESFNDGGNEPGYFDRVQFLEKLMYATGTLRGHLEAIIEQHCYWKARLAGTEPTQVVRRLDFNQASDPVDQPSVPQPLQFSLPSQQGSNLATSVTLQQAPLPPGPGLVLAPAIQAPLPLPRSRPQQQQVPVPNQGTAQRVIASPRPRSAATLSINVCLPEYMQSGIISLWETRRHTDVTFTIGTSRIPAHRLVLASQSEYFDRMLFGEMIEAQPGAEIPLPDTPLEAFQLLLKYAYSGSLKMKNVQLEEVLEIVGEADRFGFTHLKDAIGEQLAERVDQKNILQILVYADLYHLPKLNESCLCFVDGHAKEILDSQAFLSLPEHNVWSIVSRDSFVVSEVCIFQAVLRWKKHNSKTREEISGILQCVRLSEIPPEVLFAIVEPCALFEEHCVLGAIRVQMKPDLEQMRPRCKKEAGKNLFASCAKFEGYQQAAVRGGGELSAPPKGISERVLQFGGRGPQTGGGFQTYGPQVVGGLQGQGGLQLGQTRAGLQFGGLQGQGGPQLGQTGAGLQLGQTGGIQGQGGLQLGQTRAGLQLGQTGGLQEHGGPQLGTGFQFFVPPPEFENLSAMLGGRTGVLQLGQALGQTAPQLGGGHRLGHGNGRQVQPQKSNTPSVIISLGEMYHINTLQIEGSPGVMDRAAFSYAIRVSRDKQHWKVLFNYSNFSCFSTQHLCFPKQAVRHFKFECVKGNASVKFSSCSYEEDHKPFRLCENGVIAPLLPRTPLATLADFARSDAAPACLVTFNQPYSISLLRFKVRGPKASIGDITVLVSAKNEEASFVKVGEVTAKGFGTQLTAEFTERVVCCVMVVIRNARLATHTAVQSESSPPRPGHVSYKVDELTCQATDTEE